jgi:BirA family biotin operon repressor/biotin-[acetyl-CoA-carboxylase] ligase
LVQEQSPWPAWRLDAHDKLPSTSDLCVERARAGEPDGLAILARTQTAGRGSHGRAWVSAPGNLFLSALIRPESPAVNAARWSLIAGLATIEALSAHVPDASGLQLKWPNDVTLWQAKLAGVLIESAARADQMLDWLVIGVGANLVSAPILPDRRAASLSDIGPAPEPARVAETLLARLTHWRQRLAEEGFAPVRASWLARAHPLGFPIFISSPDRIVEGGYFAGLSETGALLLRSGGEVRQIVSGEVHLPLDS